MRYPRQVDFERDRTPYEIFKQQNELAKTAFQCHVLTKKSDIWWVCRQPVTGMYAFSLCFIPYRVILTGDIGSQVFEISAFDSLSWLLSSVDSCDYVLGKAEHPEFTFYLLNATDHIREARISAMACEDGEEDARLANLTAAFADELSCGEIPPLQAWEKVYRDIMEDSEVPHMHNYSAMMLFQWCALKRFVELYGSLDDTAGLLGVASD